MEFRIYRYDPAQPDLKPRMQSFEIDIEKIGAIMVLDAILHIKTLDDSISVRRSCKEGVCGSDGMNINGKNGLACITPIRSLKAPIELRPLPGMPVIRDLIVDLSNFYKQYERAEPYLQNSGPAPDRERLQTPEEREKLDGLYECILCACCTSSCPSYWWNPEKFMGPAALLQAARFVADSRDDQTRERLDKLNDAYSLYRCRSIMNCADVCPKGLNPTKAIASVRNQMIQQDV